MSKKKKTSIKETALNLGRLEKKVDAKKLEYRSLMFVAVKSATDSVYSATADIVELYCDRV